MPALDMAPIHRQTSTVDAYSQCDTLWLYLRFVFVTRLSDRIGVLPMLLAISPGPTFLVYRVPVRFRMAFDQSSNEQPTISL
jgi:hypothetical protein